MAGPAENKKKDQPKYGEGPREQYGEGYANRPEDTSKGAQESTDHDWAGGDQDKQKVAKTDQPHAGRPDKNTPKP